MMRIVALISLTIAIVASHAAAQPASQYPPPLPPPPIPTTPSATTPPATRATSAGNPECDRCGTIDSIKRVSTKDTWMPLGTVAATPLARQGDLESPSAVTMIQIERDTTKKGAPQLGAAGGPANRARPKELNAARWEVVIRMDAGDARTVTQNYEPMLREGDRVRVLGTQLELIQ